MVDNLDQMLDHRPVQAASSQSFATTQTKLRVVGTLLEDLQLELVHRAPPTSRRQCPDGVCRTKAISSCSRSTPDKSTWEPSSSKILTLTHPTGDRATSPRLSWLFPPR